MWSNRVWNPGPLAVESDPLPTALHSLTEPFIVTHTSFLSGNYDLFKLSAKVYNAI